MQWTGHKGSNKHLTGLHTESEEKGHQCLPSIYQFLSTSYFSSKITPFTYSNNLTRSENINMYKLLYIYKLRLIIPYTSQTCRNHLPLTSHNQQKPAWGASLARSVPLIEARCAAARRAACRSSALRRWAWRRESTWYNYYEIKRKQHYVYIYKYICIYVYMYTSYIYIYNVYIYIVIWYWNIYCNSEKN